MEKLSTRIIDREKLREVIAEKRWSHSYLAKRLNVSRATFSNKILGINGFNEKEIYQLYKLFGKKIFTD